MVHKHPLLFALVCGLTVMVACAVAACGRRDEAQDGGPSTPPTQDGPLHERSTQGAPLHEPSKVAPAASAVVDAGAAHAAEASSSSPIGRGACEAKDGIAFYTSPRAPVAGAPLRVLAVASAARASPLTLSRVGEPTVKGSGQRGGPPYSWSVAVAHAEAGSYRVAIGGACADIDVAVDSTSEAGPRPWSVWPVRAAWSRAYEDLYAAWIEELFDAPVDQALTWPALHEGLRDPTRNFLHDYLGEGEDDADRPKPVVIQPDCADLPYFLRAYFSYKLGLPFGYSSCTRGGGGQAPRCLKWHSNLEPRRKARVPMEAFGEFLRVTLADTVHSGTGRTLAADDRTDYYPVRTTIEGLRPGTVYADPFGHVLVVVKRVAGAGGKSGELYAVDGQPDGTVSRRRFWRGNFLFAEDPSLGSPGFKRFRPVVIEGGRPRALTNAEISANAEYADYSLDQYEGGVEGFYDHMEDVLSPWPLDPTVALLDMIDTFEEQVRGRVLSVANGQKYLAGGGATIDMPDGPEIFETTGPWEDFSTPSRDLRLLIAVDVVTGFPARVRRRPTRYALPPGAALDDVIGKLEERLSVELAKRRFSYVRSDGSSFELALADVVARQKALELAYDPNDCVEVRWGAKPGTAEAKTCRRRAPGDQQAQMRKHRRWFRERKRPPRT